MPRVSTFTPEQVAEAVQFAHENSASAAADKFSVSTPTIYAWIKKANGTLKNGNGNGHAEHSEPEEVEEGSATEKRARAAMERSAEMIGQLRADNAALKAEVQRLKETLSPMVAAALRHAASAATSVQ